MAAIRCVSSSEGGNNFFSSRITSSPKWHRNPVSSSLAALLAALECAQEAGAETIVEAEQLRVRVGGLLVTRLRRRRSAVLVWRAAWRFAVGFGHRHPDVAVRKDPVTL